jgi:hypothetical protein
MILYNCEMKNLTNQPKVVAQTIVRRKQMSSRGMISARQRNNSYTPSGNVAPHMINETQPINSTEKVLLIGSSIWVASKFQGRYYRVVVDDARQWFCSASDERVARKCKAAAQEFLQARQLVA